MESTEALFMEDRGGVTSFDQYTRFTYDEIQTRINSMQSNSNNKTVDVTVRTLINEEFYDLVRGMNGAVINEIEEHTNTSLDVIPTAEVKEKAMRGKNVVTITGPSLHAVELCELQIALIVQTIASNGSIRIDRLYTEEPGTAVPINWVISNRALDVLRSNKNELIRAVEEDTECSIRISRNQASFFAEHMIQIFASKKSSSSADVATAVENIRRDVGGRMLMEDVVNIHPRVARKLRGRKSEKLVKIMKNTGTSISVVDTPRVPFDTCSYVTVSSSSSNSSNTQSAWKQLHQLMKDLELLPKADNLEQDQITDMLLEVLIPKKVRLALIENNSAMLTMISEVSGVRAAILPEFNYLEDDRVVAIDGELSRVFHAQAILQAIVSLLKPEVNEEEEEETEESKSKLPPLTKKLVKFIHPSLRNSIKVENVDRKRKASDNTSTLLPSKRPASAGPSVSSIPNDPRLRNSNAPRDPRVRRESEVSTTTSNDNIVMPEPVLPKRTNDDIVMPEPVLPKRNTSASDDIIMPEPVLPTPVKTEVVNHNNHHHDDIVLPEPVLQKGRLPNKDKSKLKVRVKTEPTRDMSSSSSSSTGRRVSSSTSSSTSSNIASSIRRERRIVCQASVQITLVNSDFSKLDDRDFMMGTAKATMTTIKVEQPPNDALKVVKIDGSFSQVLAAQKLLENRMLTLGINTI